MRLLIKNDVKIFPITIIIISKLLQLRMSEQNEKPKNIFPLHALKVSQNTEVMVEVKTGDTYNGILMGVDKFMNIKLADAILTDSKGEKFHQIREVYIRGNTLKYFTLHPTALQKIQTTEYKCPDKWKKAPQKYRKSK